MKGVVLAFTPLVSKLAQRYARNGAEYEDLKQTGYLGVLEMAARCNDLRWLALELKGKLPQYMWRAAQKMRQESSSVDFDELAEMIPDEDMQRRFADREMEALLLLLLDDKERVIVRALQDGYSQCEIAELLGVSQPAVAQRVRKIRVKLSSVLALAKSGEKERGL